MEQIKKEIEEIISYKPSYEEKKQILRQLISFMDLTTLEGTDNEDKIKSLCYKATSLNGMNLGVDYVAAVCVYPIFVEIAKRELKDKKVKVACVAGGFPSGQMHLDLRLKEVERAVKDGTDEVDMVISRGRFLKGDYNYIFDEVKQHKQVCGKVALKVILETGELGSYENIMRASQIAIEAGADFIKTSTGKIQPAATLEASYIMLQAIREHYSKTGKKVGFKPAGGIATPQSAIEYYLLVKHILGEEWLNPELFRIGASRLFDAVVSELTSID